MLGDGLLPVTDPAEVAARLDDPAQAADVLAALTEEQVDVAEFSVGNPSLDEVFLALTGRRPDGEAAGGQPMTTDALPTGDRTHELLAIARAPAARARRCPPSATLAWRAMLKIKHVPFQLFDVTVTPIMFTLLFTYIFGGALAGSPRAVHPVPAARHPGADDRLHHRLHRRRAQHRHPEGALRPLPLAADVAAARRSSARSPATCSATRSPRR